MFQSLHVGYYKRAARAHLYFLKFVVLQLFRQKPAIQSNMRKQKTSKTPGKWSEFQNTPLYTSPTNTQALSHNTKQTKLKKSSNLKIL